MSPSARGEKSEDEKLKNRPLSIFSVRNAVEKVNDKQQQTKIIKLCTHQTTNNNNNNNEKRSLCIAVLYLLGNSSSTFYLLLSLHKNVNKIFI